MTKKEFNHYRFSTNTTAKIIDGTSPRNGYGGRVLAVDFAEGLILIEDIGGVTMYKRYENVCVGEIEPPKNE